MLAALLLAGTVAAPLGPGNAGCLVGQRYADRGAEPDGLRYRVGHRGADWDGDAQPVITAPSAG